jgi:hypothetical protein
MDGLDEIMARRQALPAHPYFETVHERLCPPPRRHDLHSAPFQAPEKPDESPRYDNFRGIGRLALYTWRFLGSVALARFVKPS